MSNKKRYTWFERAEYLAKKDELGFTADNFSTDGKYILAHRGLDTPCLEANQNAVLPDYIPETYSVEVKTGVDTGEVDGNGEAIFETVITIEQRPLKDMSPDFSDEQAMFITRIVASSRGANDGYQAPVGNDID